MFRWDDDFIQHENFPKFFLDAVYETGIALWGSSIQEKCYLYSIEPLFLNNPESKRNYLGGYDSHDTRDHYHELSGVIDLSKKIIEFKSNTEEWDFYSHRYDEYTFYRDYVTSFQRLSTRHQCFQYYERLIEKCDTDTNIDIQSNENMFLIKINLSSRSPIDWGRFLNIRFIHHPSSW